MPRFCEQCGCEHATQEEIEEQARKLQEGICNDDPLGSEQLPHERGGILDDSTLAIVGDNPRETILPDHISKGEASEVI